MHECIKYKYLSLVYKVLTTTQLLCLCNLLLFIFFNPFADIRSSSVVIIEGDQQAYLYKSLITFCNKLHIVLGMKFPTHIVSLIPITLLHIHPTSQGHFTAFD